MGLLFNTTKDKLTDSDIVIDQEAFQAAITDLEMFISEIKSLYDEAETMLNEVMAGFITPSGIAFENSFRNNVLKPIIDQMALVTHVKANIESAKSKYDLVFEEYEHLQKTITDNTEEE